MLASLDIGTNTVRLLIGEVEDGQVVPEKYRRRITRLGGGYTEDRGLSRQAMERTSEALADFSAEIRAAGIRTVRAVGTEALRKAANGRAFAEKIEAETGLRLDIVDGEEEARLSASGVLAALSPRPARCLIFDVGGGSTEFIFVESGEVRFHKSYPLGVVRLAEDVGTDSGIDAAIASVLERLGRDLAAGGQALEAGDDFVLVGTAGTVTTLAAIDLEMDEYDWRRVNNHRIEARDLERMQRRLQPLSAEQREDIPGMEEGRGDLIVPGIRIVRKLMDQLGCSVLSVSDFGLLEGVLLDLSRHRNH